MNNYDIALNNLNMYLKELLEEKENSERKLEESREKDQNLTNEIKDIDSKIKGYQAKAKEISSYEETKKNNRKKHIKNGLLTILKTAIGIGLGIALNSLIGCINVGFIDKAMTALNYIYLLLGIVLSLGFIAVEISECIIDNYTLKKNIESMSLTGIKKLLDDNLIKRFNLETDKKKNKDKEQTLLTELNNLGIQIAQTENNIYLVQNRKQAAVDKLVAAKEAELNLSYKENGLSVPILERNKMN